METYVDLSRYFDAHKQSYQNALKEIKNGHKYSHWMWFIFPQIHGLGRSSTSQYYAIKSLDEATAFLQDPYLGGNLLEICHALLVLDTNNATEVFGKPDDRKLKSSMTLFSLVPNASPVFQNVLDKFFDGKRDQRTLAKSANRQKRGYVPDLIFANRRGYELVVSFPRAMWRLSY